MPFNERTTKEGMRSWRWQRSLEHHNHCQHDLLPNSLSSNTNLSSGQRKTLVEDHQRQQQQQQFVERNKRSDFNHSAYTFGSSLREMDKLLCARVRSRFVDLRETLEGNRLTH